MKNTTDMTIDTYFQQITYYANCSYKDMADKTWHALMGVITLALTLNIITDSEWSYLFHASLAVKQSI